MLASDLALDATNQDISINNIGTNLRSAQIDSVNLPEIKTPVSSPDWGPALNQRITWMVANSLQNANITVNPPNLGPLEINIQTDQNKTNVQFIVSSSEVRQAIQDAGASAVAAASIFHFTERTPAEAKNYLASVGIAVRQPFISS